MLGRQGSQVHADRLRFDFNLPRGMSEAEVGRVEALVNGWVAADHALTTRTVPLAEARAAGARPLGSGGASEAVPKPCELA